MPLPVNFSGAPGEEPHRYFRNLCIEFKKAVQQEEGRQELEQRMQDFIEASKAMNWHDKTSGVHHKQEGEKVTQKVWEEFQRYVHAEHHSTANPQGLLSALDEIQRLIKSFKVD